MAFKQTLDMTMHTAIIQKQIIKIIIQQQESYKTEDSCGIVLANPSPSQTHGLASNLSPNLQKRNATK